MNATDQDGSPTDNGLSQEPGHPTGPLIGQTPADASSEQDDDIQSPESSPGTATVVAAADERVQDLVVSLGEHAARRGGAPPPADIMLACCLTLLRSPPDVGVRQADLSPLDSIQSGLAEPASDTLPEATACDLWISCLRNPADDGVAARLGDLIRSGLWPPVEALAYRVLAYLGHRRMIAGLLAGKSVLSPFELDAWLDASVSGAPDDDQGPDSDRSLGASYLGRWADQWSQLGDLEVGLAFDPAVPPIAASLVSLTEHALPASSRSLEDVVARRAVARAIGVFIRARLGCDSLDPVDGWLGRGLLPAWEECYLRGVVSWRLNDLVSAVSHLEASIRENPYQTSPRISLSTLQATTDVDAALGTLGHDRPTRPIYLARATLLARLGRYREATMTLEECDADEHAGNEPARFRWGRANEPTRLQDAALRTALAEHRGDWAEAERWWRRAGELGMDRGAHLTRQLYAGQRELDASKTGRGWRRSTLEQRSERIRRQVGSTPLDADGLFFRGLTTVDADPTAAVRDLRALMRRRAWVRDDVAVGGAKLRHVGDVLVTLGCLDEARRAYQLVAPTARVRLAAVSIIDAGRSDRGPEGVRRVVGIVEDMAEDPWVALMGSLALFARGETETGRRFLENARELGAPSRIVEHIGALVHAVTEQPSIGQDDWLSELPAGVKALVRLLHGAEEEGQRLVAFAAGLAPRWMDRYPGDPERVAQHLFAALMAVGAWDEVERLGVPLLHSGRIGARELAAVAMIGHALHCAVQGRWPEADRILEEVGACLDGGDTSR